jgi:hypothetical protein
MISREEIYVRLKVLMAVNMKRAASWVVAQFSMVEVC